MALFFNLVISSVGLAYFVYGKKTTRLIFLIVGLVLMFYSYFIPGVALNVGVGIILALVPFVLKSSL
ncbi:MAG: hypothetical protein M0Z55_11110 [Peptococcaceae bacterium]|nr:hypothetical protein [Peptococcaceae bacterium]